MMAKRVAPAAPESPQVRCGIYTRKSSEDGLQLEFNSLDAQREAAEAYVASQRHEGWVCLPERYDDGGFSGGTVERPGLQRLLADIRDGRVDCVVVYKVDRLSRSLLDFSKIMETFENHRVSFVSVTQQFNTTHSMGRLTLNILLSFAQFEREIIGERIRDKLAAQRQKGKWTGGTPVLGFDVDRSGPSPKLVINVAEAQRVRLIFGWYLELQSLLEVQRRLNQRGWCTKTWTTRRGSDRGGSEFDKKSVHALLTNPLYVGNICHKERQFKGEHQAIIEPATFAAVQKLLKQNSRTGASDSRNRHNALLRGLLWCTACQRAMVHTFTKRKNRMYRYYTCTKAISSGHDRCPKPSISAHEVETTVLDHVRRIAADSELRSEVLRQAQDTIAAELKQLDELQKPLLSQRRHLESEIRNAALKPVSPAAIDELAELQRRTGKIDLQLEELERQRTERQGESITPEEVGDAFANFDDLWNHWSPREQANLVELLVAKVECHTAEGAVSIVLHDSAIRKLMHRTRETQDVAH